MSQTLENSSLEAARAAKAQAREIFAALAPVNGVGITRIGAGYGIKINLRQAPGAGVALPENINGVPVRVEVVGAITKR